MNLTGMIFKAESKEYRSSPLVTTYWLVTGDERFGSYPTVKCSSTGKAYKSTNGFSAKSMLELQKNKKIDYRRDDAGTLYTLVREPGLYVQERANIDTAIVVTKLKNRISYLEAEIASATTKLAKAKAELEKIEKSFDFSD